MTHWGVMLVALTHKGVSLVILTFEGVSLVILTHKGCERLDLLLKKKKKIDGHWHLSFGVMWSHHLFYKKYKKTIQKTTKYLE